MKRLRAGFTLVELLIVMGISAIVFSITIISLTPLIPKSNSRAEIELLKAAIAEQRTKSQSGYTSSGSSPTAQSIYFEETQYVLYEGITYNPSDPENSTFPLEQGLRFTAITLPNSSLVFSAISGEVRQFVEGQNSVTLRSDHLNDSVILSVNRFGITE